MEWYFTNLDFPQNKGDFPYFSPPFGVFGRVFGREFRRLILLISGWLCGVPSGGNQSTPPTLPGKGKSSGPQQPLKGKNVSCLEGILLACILFPPFYVVVGKYSAVTKKGEHVCLLACFFGGEKSHTNLTWNVSPTTSQKLSSTQMDQLLLHVFQTFLQLLLCPVAQRENLGSMINGFVSSGWISLTNPLVVVYLESVNVLPFTVLNSFLNVCAVYLVARLLVSHVAVGKLGCNHHENPW